MLEDLLNLRRRFAIARHREAPLLKEREKFSVLSASIT